MEQHTLSAILQDQTARALWEVKNVIDCVPDSLWDNLYCGMPCWKHIYHMLHSLDVWMINPRDPNYQEPSIHEPGLNNLDFVSSKQLTRTEINQYLQTVSQKSLLMWNSFQTISCFSIPRTANTQSSHCFWHSSDTYTVIWAC